MIKKYRAPSPLRTLLLTGAMALAATAITTSANALSYTPSTYVDGTSIRSDFSVSNVSTSPDTFTFNLGTTPGTLELNGSAFGIALSSITVSGGASVTIMPIPASAYSFYFTLPAGATTDPLVLTYTYTGTGSYDGHLRFTPTQGGGTPVPGPIAGAGIPAAFAFGGLLWARRRKAATA